MCIVGSCALCDGDMHGVLISDNKGNSLDLHARA